MAEDTRDEVVRFVLELTKPGSDEHERRVQAYDRAYEVYRPQRRSQRLRLPYADLLRIPYAMFILDTALVNLVQDPPRALVRPRAPQWADRAQAFQKILDHFADLDRLALKHVQITQSALLYGLAVCKTHWLFEQREVVVRGERKVITTRDGPSCEVWDVYDVWWDPNARSVDDARYVALRSWLDEAQLRRQACSLEEEHDTSMCDGLFHRVEELIRLGPYGSQRRLRAQDRFNRKEQAARLKLYQVVEYWIDDQVVVIGNDHVLLRHARNPHWHGEKPVAFACTRPDLRELRGIPETELVDHIQEALWANHNLRFQNLLLTVERMFTYREGSPFDPSQVRIGPRALIPVTDHTDLQPVAVQPLPPEAYREEAELLQRMQLVTGITPFVSGAAPLPGVSDQTTATGVSLLTETASRLLRFKAEQIQRGIWERVFRQWGNDVQQFLNREMWVRVIGEDGRETFQQLGPEDVVGEFDFGIEASSVAVSKQQRRQELLALLNALAPFAQAGLLDMQELILRLAKVFDFDDPARLLAAKPTPSGASSVSQPLPDSQPPGALQAPGLDPRVLQQLASMVAGSSR